MWLMTLPRVRPIIPTWRKEPFDNPDWLFESKYDGSRALLYLEKGKGRFIWGRHSTLSRFDPLCNQVATELDINDAILDGEIIAADKTGHSQLFNLPRRTPRPPFYLVFDILWLNGSDLRSLVLYDRRRLLERILPKRSAVISQAASVVGSGRELFAIACEHDLVGVVAKRLKDPYQPSVRWLRMKNPGPLAKRENRER